MPRVLLGRCLHGKLILKPSRRSQGVDLYWHGDSLVGAFDYMLHDTILKSWRRLGMLPVGNVPRPILTKVGDTYWICRLPHGDYALEAQDGGISLYLVGWHS